MKIIIDFLKGVCIGVANVIPGFSGGTMAVILNIYERVINGFSNFFKSPIKTLKDLWAVVIGLVVGIVIAILTITKLLSTFPIPTSLFFVGLIIGSIPNLFQSYASYQKVQVLDIIFFMLAMAVIIILPLLNSNNTQVTNVNMGIIILMFVLGAICAAAMVLPGVSGSLVLMAFGYYLFLMDNIGILIESVLTLNFDNFVNPFFIVLSFGIGAVIGIVFISKVLKYLFEKHPRTIYAIILGLLVASPFAIIYAVIKQYNDVIVNTSPLSYVIGIVCMAIGAFIVLLPNIIEKSKKNEN